MAPPTMGNLSCYPTICHRPFLPKPIFSLKIDRIKLNFLYVVHMVIAHNFSSGNFDKKNLEKYEKNKKYKWAWFRPQWAWDAHRQEEKTRHRYQHHIQVSSKSDHIPRSCAWTDRQTYKPAGDDGPILPPFISSRNRGNFKI